MTLPSFTFTNDSIIVVTDGKLVTVQRGTPQFTGLRQAILNEDWDGIPNFLTVATSLQSWLGDKFTIDGTRVMYDGIQVPSSIIDRINKLAREGGDPSPLLAFYERLHKNPSYRSREGLFTFMQFMDIPIEPDGTFLAYKGVNTDYTDCHTGQIPNTPGMKHAMPRNLVSDDPRTACHFGFHVGALSYASSFGSIVIICRVDPEHVVCVPHDESSRKMRVCEYEVVGNWNGQEMPAMEPAKAEISDEGGEWNQGDDGEGIVSDCVDDDDDQGYRDAVAKEAQLGDGDGVGINDASDPLDYSDEELHASADRANAKATPKAPVFKQAKQPRYGHLDAKGLMGKPIEELRKYASAGLKILGASKIAGGKSALVSRILKVRRGRK